MSEPVNPETTPPPSSSSPTTNTTTSTTSSSTTAATTATDAATTTTTTTTATDATITATTATTTATDATTATTATDATTATTDATIANTDATIASTDATTTTDATTAIRIPEHLLHKNRLQEYTQRASIPLPIYHTRNEGFPHLPKFMSTVWVDGAAYTSPNAFLHRKPAEQDVAKIALESILKKIKEEGCPLIHADTIFCKSILNEYAVKMNLEKPTYTTIQSEGLLPVFMSSLVFNGVTYTGDAGRNKKEAEQLGARAVILTILGNSGSGTVLHEIIKSKGKLYAALHKVQGSNYVHNSIVPVGVYAGNSQNTGNSSVISLNKGKEVEIAVGTENNPTTAFSEASQGMLTNRPVLPPAFHEFKSPKPEPLSEAIPPIIFVPSVLEQSLGGESSSGKRRNRKNKKKSNKKLRIEAQLPVDVLPVSQAPPCSVAQ